MKLFLFLMLFSFMVLGVFGQTSSKLMDNKMYLDVISNIDVHTEKRDSVIDRLSELKNLVNSDPMLRSKFINSIFEYEGALYELESQIMELSSKKATLEQSSNPEMDDNGALFGAVSSGHILNDQYILGNLSAEERSVLMNEKTMNSAFYHADKQLNEFHLKIKSLDEKLRLSGLDVSSADSLKLLANKYIKEAQDLEKWFVINWGEIYDTKLYVYSRIMQDLGVEQDIIERLGSKRIDIKAKLLKDNSNVFEGAVYSYNKEKRHSNDYELIIAQEIDNKSVLDSLLAVINSPLLGENKQIEIELPNYNYSNYSDLYIYKSDWFKGVEDNLPFINVPTVGTVYAIRVATLSKSMTSRSSLRKLKPLFRFKNNQGATEYYVGVYRTALAAQKDMNRLKSIGYKPVLTEFVSGGKILTDGSIYPVDAHEYLYCLEFDEMNEDLETELKSLSPSKHISIVDGGKYLLGIFDKYDEVAEIMKHIKANCKIIKLDK